MRIDMLDKKLLAVIVVIVLIVIYLILKRSNVKPASKEKLKKKRGKTRVSRPTRTRTRNKKIREPEYDDDDLDEDESTNNVDEEEVVDDAEELFNLVHDQMASGMQSGDFMEIAGDIADDLTFIEIKQLYNDATNKKEDPSHAVTVDDYIDVLKKMKAGEH